MQDPVRPCAQYSTDSYAECRPSATLSGNCRSVWAYDVGCLAQLIDSASGLNGARLALLHSGLFTAGFKMRIPLFHLRTRNAGLDNTALDSGEITIRVVRASSQSTVTVTGRVTVDSSPHLRSVLLELLREGRDRSSSSICPESRTWTCPALRRCWRPSRQLARRSVTLRVLGMTGQSRMLAEIAELDKIFQSAGSEVEFR